LVLAVAEAGGLGMLGGVMLPPQVLAGMLDDLAARTRGAFGVNFLMPFLDRDAVPVAATRARVVEFFYGEPEAALVDAVHAGGALACWQVGSLGEAVAAARAGCDLIVAQGTEAGGHVRGRVGLLPLLNAVLDSVDIPVIAAGGIGTARDVAATLAAGAAGVGGGARLVAAPAGGAPPQDVAAPRPAGAGETGLAARVSGVVADPPHPRL